MRYLATAALALTTIFSTMTTTASDAEARRWHRHHGGAIALGIAGAVIGGIALSRHRYYYDDYYYGGGWDYPYYRRSYFYGGPRFYGGPSFYGRPYYYGRPFYGRRVIYRAGPRFHRRGWGGPAWGVRGGRWGRRW